MWSGREPGDPAEVLEPDSRRARRSSMRGRTLTPDMVLGEAPRDFCDLTTDTRPVPAIAEYAADNDLLSVRACTAKEKIANARENKHMMFQEAAKLGKEANPREMWLTHYSPSLMHPEEYLNEIRRFSRRSRPPAMAGLQNWI